MRYYGDGPSYDASRVVPRNLTGFAPGKWQEEPPTIIHIENVAKGLENLSAAADEGRAYPNEDLSGRVHPEGSVGVGQTSATYKPVHGRYPPAGKRGPEAVVMDHTGQITREIYAEQYAPTYFDAVRLASALAQIAHDWQAKAWRIETILRSYRLATSEAERASILITLKDVYTHLNIKDVQAAVEIEDLINTIDMV